jgi:hypothetical protein
MNRLSEIILVCYIVLDSKALIHPRLVRCIVLDKHVLIHAQVVRCIVLDTQVIIHAQRKRCIVLDTHVLIHVLDAHILTKLDSLVHWTSSPSFQVADQAHAASRAAFLCPYMHCKANAEGCFRVWLRAEHFS